LAVESGVAAVVRRKSAKIVTAKVGMFILVVEYRWLIACLQGCFGDWYVIKKKKQNHTLTNNHLKIWTETDLKIAITEIAVSS
jgi:hypothetical protein